MPLKGEILAVVREILVKTSIYKNPFDPGHNDNASYLAATLPRKVCESKKWGRDGVLTAPCLAVVRVEKARREGQNNTHAHFGPTP
jgi:glycogen debranching enzyme